MLSNVWVSPLGQRTVAEIEPEDFPSPKKSSFVCCRKKATSRLQAFGLAEIAGSDRDGCADCIAIAFGCRANESRRSRRFRHCVLQNSELRGRAIFQDNFQASIVVEIGKREGATVIEKIEAEIPETSEKVPS